MQALPVPMAIQDYNGNDSWCWASWECLVTMPGHDRQSLACHRYVTYRWPLSWGSRWP